MMAPSKRRQLWLLPPTFLAILLLILPFITVHLLPHKSKLHQELSSFRRAKNDVRASTSSQTVLPFDGTFNGVPLYYRENTPPTYSSIHCIGETFQPKYDWIHRSCHYRHFCFDVVEKEFVLFQSPQEKKLQTLVRKQNMTHISTLINNDQKVSIGGINTKWTWRRGVPRLKWSPKILEKLPDSYYQMNTTWIPFHSMAGFNPGHLVWDDWLPIYTLLQIFQLHSLSPKLLMRFVLSGDGMWATCDFNIINKEKCRHLFDKFLPLMGVDNSTIFTTNQDYQFVENVPNLSKYVCATQGVAGIGMLTDHGIKTHGWDPDDYKYTHNHGRGSQLFDFSQFMVQNVLGDRAPPFVVQGPPYKITFSTNSSRSDSRGLDFHKQIEAVRSSFPRELVKVQAYELKELSLEEQVRVAAESAIFVTVCGGGAVTATFLPAKASVLLYFNAAGGVKDNVDTRTPARLDWDYFEHASHLSVHWLPTADMDSPKELQILVELMKHQVELLQQQNNNAIR